MRCPKCGLTNPEYALRCDCGYDFATRTMKESHHKPKASPFENLASLDQRLIGQILDSLVAIAVIVISAVPFVLGLDTIGDVSLVFGVIAAFFYILFADGFRGGQSYGKRVMKTAVVDASTGQPCTLGKSFVRNLLLSILGIIDWIFIFGKKRQRLGDKAAHTVVVKT